MEERQGFGKAAHLRDRKFLICELVPLNIKVHAST